VVPNAGHLLARLRRPSVLAEVGFVLLLLVCSVILLRQASIAQRFTIDESRWISTSRYFWTTFVEWDLFGEEWQPNYLVLTHPPVARYLIGAGLAVQGWTPDRLNGRYDSLRGRTFNERAGNVPGPDLLAAARRVIAIGSIALMYVIGRALGGPLVAGLTVGFAVANPLLSTLWTRALAESILAFFSLLALTLAMRVVRQAERAGGFPTGAVAAGAALGLASATKLSAVLLGAGLAVFAALQQALLWLRHRRIDHLPWFDLALAAMIVFFLVNPLLYPDAFGRTAMMFQHRREEMRQQQRNWPDQAVAPDLGSRVEVVARRVFVQYPTLQPPGPIPVEGLLVALGMVAAVARSWREVAAGRPLGAHALILCWTVVTYVGITVNLGFDSSHYYASPLTVNCILAALAAARGIWLLASQVQKLQLPARYIGRRTAQTPSSATTANPSSNATAPLD
jgi:hypothetical protein